MGRWLSMLESEKSTNHEPTKPTEVQKGTLVGLVGNESRHIQKNKSKSGRWLSLIEPEKIIEAVKREQPKTPKVWKLKIRSSDGMRIYGMTMIDPARFNREECKAHLARQFGEKRVISFMDNSG